MPSYDVKGAQRSSIDYCRAGHAHDPLLFPLEHHYGPSGHALLNFGVQRSLTKARTNHSEAVFMPYLLSTKIG
jgi:hypothetical protein